MTTVLYEWLSRRQWVVVSSKYNWWLAQIHTCTYIYFVAYVLVGSDIFVGIYINTLQQIFMLRKRHSFKLEIILYIYRYVYTYVCIYNWVSPALTYMHIFLFFYLRIFLIPLLYILMRKWNFVTHIWSKWTN